MKQALTPEEKAIYFNLLQDLVHANSEFEIKSIEFEIIQFITQKRENRKNIEDFDEKAATSHFMRSGILKN